jgi:hypothetical protein
LTYERLHTPPIACPATQAPSCEARPPAGGCGGCIRPDVDGWIHVSQRRVAFGIRRRNLTRRNLTRRNLDHHDNLDQQHDRCNTSDRSDDHAEGDRRHYGNDGEGIDAVKLSP